MLISPLRYVKISAMKNLFNILQRTLRGGGANKYTVVMETDCITLVDNVVQIRSFAAGKTKDGWDIFGYEYLPEDRWKDTYENSWKSLFLEDKTYSIEVGEQFRNVKFKRFPLFMPARQDPLSFEQAVERLKELEASGSKNKNFQIEDPRVEPDRHYSKFQTPDDVPKRRKRIRHWKP